MESADSLHDVVDSLKDRLNAAMICISHSWGGLEQVAANDALEIHRAGLKVRMLCLHGSPIHQHLQAHRGFPVAPIHFRPRNYFDFKFRSELRGLVQEGVNVLHAHQPSLLGSITPWFWSRQSRIALLATRHILSNHDKRNFFHQAIYRRLDTLMVISQALRRNVLATHPIREAHVRVVSLGLDFDYFDPSRTTARTLRQRWGVQDDEVLIGLVGRIDPAKGQDTFIKAAAGLLKGDLPPQKLRFFIIGEETLRSSGEYLMKLKEMITQFKLEGWVTFTGFMDQIPEVMAALDILVMPSREEAFGLVAIEAMAMERPVIVSDRGSAEEIVGEDEFGLRIRPDDAYSLQEKLRFLLDSEERRRTMGQRAREHVMKNYDRRVRLMKTLQAYEKAMRRRRI